MSESRRQKQFLRKYKRDRFLTLFLQVFIAMFLLVVWEVLANYGIINSFITSSPSRIFKTIFDLFKTGDLIHHICVTLNETIISFLITGVVSILVSILIYKCDMFSKVIDPYLTIFNSLPKVALGPVLIIWVGANNRSIILMAVLISIIVSIQAISVGLKNTPRNRIKLLKTFGASELDVLRYAVIPSNTKVIVNAFKINIGMCFIGS